jgi:hypothetical protein
MNRPGRSAFRWRHNLVESVALVASILLAFSIDALEAELSA